MRGSFLRALAVGSAIAALGCRQSAQLHGEGAPANHAGEPGPGGAAGAGAPPAKSPAKPRGPVPEAEALKPRPDLPPERRALVVIGAAPAQNDQPARPGEERWIDADLAEAAGYTLVDLSRRLDAVHLRRADGRRRRAAAQPLPPHLRRPGERPARRGRRAAAAGREELPRALRHLPVDLGAAGALRQRRGAPLPRPGERRRAGRGRDGHLRRRPPRSRRTSAAWRASAQELETARRKAHVGDAGRAGREAARSSRRKVKLLAKRAAEKPAMAAVEKRLTCEGLLNAPKGAKHQAGIYDDAMRLAVRRFQQKHMIYEANFLRRKTVEALARSLLDNDYDALRARPARARGRRRRRSSRTARLAKTRQPRRRVHASAAIDQLGLTRRARRRWRSSSATPARTISSGSAWRSSCRRAPTTTAPRWTCRSSSIAATSGTTCRSTTRGTTSRSRARTTRSLTLYTKVGGKQIALARWRTTIGGWRAEQATERLRVLPLQGCPTSGRA